jgi:predicted transcriptional regulator
MHKKRQKITEKQKAIIVKSLASGASQAAAAKKVGITASAVCQNKSLINKSNMLKKEVEKEVREGIKNNIETEVKGMSRIIGDCLHILTPKRLAKAPVGTVAMITGILTDKRQLITGGVTETIEIRDSSTLKGDLTKELAGQKKSANFGKTPTQTGSKMPVIIKSD